MEYQLEITITLKKKNIDLKNIATNLIQHFLRQAVRDGFHADMHEGNLFVDDNGNIVPVDFGIMGRLDKSNKKYLAEILYGFIKRDYVKVAEVHFQAGLVPETASKEEFAQALRSVGEPIFGQNIKDISGGNLLSQLLKLLKNLIWQLKHSFCCFKKLWLLLKVLRENCIQRQIFGMYQDQF